MFSTIRRMANCCTPNKCRQGSLSRLLSVPQVEGFAFQHWFAMDKELNGRQDVEYI